MKTSAAVVLLFSAFAAFSFTSRYVTPPATPSYWIRFCATKYADSCGYLSANGDTMIPAGKYFMCETDTFRSYAKVCLRTTGEWVAINKSGNILYKIHVMDNGPDYVSEGLFRIWKNGKMVYADERTGKIILYPQYTCGFPFEKGLAKVSLTACESKPVDKYGEYHYWETDEWIYIDHTGKQVAAPK